MLFRSLEKGVAEEAAKSSLSSSQTEERVTDVREEGSKGGAEEVVSSEDGGGVFGVPARMVSSRRTLRLRVTYPIVM